MQNEPATISPLPAAPAASLGALVCVGVSHRTAPLAVRERITLQGEAARTALLQVAGNGEHPAEVLLVDTCHRIEWYAAGLEAAELCARVRAAVADAGHAAPADLDAFFAAAYELDGAMAAEHLLRVAAGLDSMIVGEYQILGQVRAAAEQAEAAGTLGPVLRRVSAGAVRVGRKARTETELGRGAASIPSAAVALAQAAGGMEGGVVVVIGAGKMGVLTAKSLVGLGARRVIVSNRSYERAMALAAEWDGCAVTFDRLGEALDEADVVIASTAAPHPVVTREMLAASMDRRGGRSLTLVDIAVPRDVEPSAAELPGVTIFTVDDLEATVRDGLSERATAVPAVETMVAAELAELASWVTGLAVEPVVASLYRWAEAVRDAEVAKTLRRRPGATEREAEALSALAAALIGKLLHPVAVGLKARAGTREGAEAAALLQELFALGNASPPAAGNGRHELAADEALDGGYRNGHGDSPEG